MNSTETEIYTNTYNKCLENGMSCLDALSEANREVFLYQWVLEIDKEITEGIVEDLLNYTKNNP